jgi:hypothetical protein
MGLCRLGSFGCQVRQSILISGLSNTRRQHVKGVKLFSKRGKSNANAYMTFVFGSF